MLYWLYVATQGLTVNIGDERVIRTFMEMNSAKTKVKLSASPSGSLVSETPADKLSLLGKGDVSSSSFRGVGSKCYEIMPDPNQDNFMAPFSVEIRDLAGNAKPFTVKVYNMNGAAGRSCSGSKEMGNGCWPEFGQSAKSIGELEFLLNNNDQFVNLVKTEGGTSVTAQNIPFDDGNGALAADVLQSTTSLSYFSGADRTSQKLNNLEYLLWIMQYSAYRAYTLMTKVYCFASGEKATFRLCYTGGVSTDETSCGWQGGSTRRLNEEEGHGRRLSGGDTEVEEEGTGSSGDPHLRFAHGGRADFRGKNNTVYNIISAPRFSFNARTTDAYFRLPYAKGKNGQQYVDGSFFTHTYVVIENDWREQIRLEFDANLRGFLMTNRMGKTMVDFRNAEWKTYKDRVASVELRYLTTIVTTADWQVNVTRKAIYNPNTGPRYRFDFTMHNFKDKIAHGIIGQSWDGDNIAVSGKMDDYDSPNVVTKSMAEGAIEGTASDYELHDRFATDFKYSCFYKPECKARDVTRLFGPRSAGTASRIAQSDDER